jgi:hypothetical protein
MKNKTMNNGALFLLFVTVGITTGRLVLWLCFGAVAVGGEALLAARRKKNTNQ